MALVVQATTRSHLLNSSPHSFSSSGLRGCAKGALGVHIFQIAFPAHALPTPTIIAMFKPIVLKIRYLRACIAFNPCFSRLSSSVGLFGYFSRPGYPPLGAVIEDGSIWRYWVPTAELPAAWKDPGFYDAAWAMGPSGFGYPTETTPRPYPLPLPCTCGAIRYRKFRTVARRPVLHGLR